MYCEFFARKKVLSYVHFGVILHRLFCNFCFVLVPEKSWEEIIPESYREQADEEERQRMQFQLFLPPRQRTVKVLCVLLVELMILPHLHVYLHVEGSIKWPPLVRGLLSLVFSELL